MSESPRDKLGDYLKAFCRQQARIKRSVIVRVELRDGASVDALATEEFDGESPDKAAESLATMAWSLASNSDKALWQATVASVSDQGVTVNKAPVMVRTGEPGDLTTGSSANTVTALTACVLKLVQTNTDLMKAYGDAQSKLTDGLSRVIDVMGTRLEQESAGRIEADQIARDAVTLAEEAHAKQKPEKRTMEDRAGDLVEGAAKEFVTKLLNGSNNAEEKAS